MDSARRDLLPPLLSLPLTTATDATGKEQKPRDKSKRVDELGTSPRQKRLAALQKAAEQAAAEAAAPDGYVGSVVASMWNYRKWEAEAKWISNENKPPDEGRWTRCELDWASSTFFQICEAVCTECKYPDIYWVREMSPKGLSQSARVPGLGADGVRCRLLDSPADPGQSYDPYRNPLGQNEHMESTRAFMRNIQNLVTLDAVAQLATDVIAASFKDPELGNFMADETEKRAGYYELVDWQTKKGDAEPIQVHAFGDYHGSLHSFAMQHSCAENRRAWYDKDDKLKSHIRLVFLGDYIDRSFYSLEVLYLVFRLKKEFPDQVRVLAGNHEDPYADVWGPDTVRGLPSNRPPNFLKERMFWCGYGTQWEAAWSRDETKVDIPMEDQLVKIEALFHLLPKAIMAWTDLGLIQFSHGVAEKSLFPIRQVEGAPYYPNPNAAPAATATPLLAQRALDFFDFLHPPAGVPVNSARFPVEDGQIVWSDIEEFTIDAKGGVSEEVGGRWALSAKALRAYLERFNIQTIVRGHQHNQSLSLATGFDPDHDEERDTPPWFINSSLSAQGRFITGRYAMGKTPDGLKPYGNLNYDMTTWLPKHAPWNWTWYDWQLFGYKDQIQPNARPSPLHKDDAALNHFKVELYGECKNRQMPLAITTASSGWSCVPKSNLHAFSPVITFTKKRRSEVAAAATAAAAAAAAAAEPSSPTGPDVDMAGVAV